MKFLVLLLIIFCFSRAEAQEFICGFTAEGRGAIDASSSATQDDAYYRNGTIRPLILFGKFKGQPDPVDLNALLDREGIANQRADSLLSINHEGSLAHYFSEMSAGDLTLAALSGGIDTNWYMSDSTSVFAYVGSDCKRRVDIT